MSAGELWMQFVYFFVNGIRSIPIYIHIINGVLFGSIILFKFKKKFTLIEMSNYLFKFSFVVIVSYVTYCFLWGVNIFSESLNVGQDNFYSFAAEKLGRDLYPIINFFVLVFLPIGFYISLLSGKISNLMPITQKQQIKHRIIETDNRYIDPITGLTAVKTKKAFNNLIINIINQSNRSDH